MGYGYTRIWVNAIHLPDRKGDYIVLRKDADKGPCIAHWNGHTWEHVDKVKYPSDGKVMVWALTNTVRDCFSSLSAFSGKAVIASSASS
jgi:hypothetical protein